MTEPRGDIATSSETRGNPFRIRFGMRTALMIGFGGLVLAAAATVLFLGLWSARENTVSLTRKLAHTVLDDVQTSIEQRLRPVEAAVEHLGHRVERGEIKTASLADLSQALSSALAGLPQAGALLFLDAQGNGLQAIREKDSVTITKETYSHVAEIMDQITFSKGQNRAHWGRVLRPPGVPYTLLNVRRPVRLDGEFVGVLVASVSISELSTMLAQASLALDGEIFVLYDQNFVLAHRRLVKGFKTASPEHPLPSVDDLGDPVLIAYLHPEVGPEYGGRMSRDMGIQIVGTQDGEAYPLIARRLNWFGEAPWEIGVYFQNEDVEAEFKRVLWASIAGLIAVLLSLLLAWALAKHISQPLKDLDRAARRIRDLSLADIPALPASRIREMNDAGQAFNAMISSLRWFETYVPRSLVRRLMRQDDGAIARSVQREVTVMFTDIVGFTPSSEQMGAEETAALLNDHFAEVGACIEAQGGTIDKYIGDAVMAFWGAPEEQPDHAARACRAALAIRAAVEASNKANESNGKAPLHLRIGLHSGPVIVGNIGAPQRMNYTIVGDSVNVSHRLEELGRGLPDPDSAVTIIISQATRDAAHIQDAVDLGPQRIRGRREALTVYRF
ncbi:MAG: adenylate/guanylate cyclase domain-containing protein [Alphaproteobacteria bacterium]|jgi:class 3 adenylate cyclase|nr:adenylate/guanylate cyclase domain-containing protein [Alphaproteobacteria bacterium]MDP6832943.1 adenylate/guanylate cyclase domain-containing protein [Alphaproteobacteria bacterium]MDP6873865.1 adenylate/guanylate cyclase domain-containing protein [Alphaproteobacteria bacterium]